MSGHDFRRPDYVPVSTYRLQVHAGFPLPDAARVVPYLDRLGISTVYTSPYFTAAPGSTHGYDVCNHNEINPELGGGSAHLAFSKAVRAAGMGHIVDFVPNHMGIGAGGNAWWNDVLENGPSAAAAAYFDIDWAPLKVELQAKLLLPILGDQYGNVLERGELKLQFSDGALSLRYFDHELPINPREAPRVLALAVGPITARLGQDNPQLHEFLSILTSLGNLPAYTEQDPGRVSERHREKEVARHRLARLADEDAGIAAEISAAVEHVNGRVGDPASFNTLHGLLEAQVYRLSYWRTASHEINYRRFFDVNSLAGLCIERAEVFEATHRLLAQLLTEGRLQGVRVDHPDGLFDPARYFEMLQALFSRGTSPAAGTQVAVRASSGDPRLYVVAEKILSGRERLPGRWPVHGTTGYNYLNDQNGLFVDIAQGRRLHRIYSKLTGHIDLFDDVLYQSKRLIMDTAMASELNVLAHVLDRIGEGNRRSRDFTLEALRDVITEVVACFPVYRTYVNEHGWTPEDRAVVEQAIVRARRRNPAMESSLFDFFREVVLPRDPVSTPAKGEIERRGGYPPADDAEGRERLRFAMKLQQYTGPVHAKGLEDTAFYRYNVLVSLNEVGGDPSRIGRSVEDFHDGNLHRARCWPFEMLATSTHDTKMGEDVRARINVLSEFPDDWGREVSRWMRINRAHRSIVDGDPAPDRVDEYRIYQALIGGWPTQGSEPSPAFVARMSEYMVKAAREAKRHTSWLTPNPAYEDGLTKFIHSILGTPGGKFLSSFLPFQQRIALLGVTNSLAQVALKIASVGVPDFYQGSELWDLNFVDPDNRRPVDFQLREQMLERLGDVPVETLLGGWEDGRIKMLVTTRGLHLRRELPGVFGGGDYLPLTTEISVPGDIVAFARSAGGDVVITAVPRLVSALTTGVRPFPLGGDCWKTSRIMLPESMHDRTFRDVFTGSEIRPTVSSEEGWLFVGQLFERLPVAILRAVSA
jgi:(1->4)-alpha-D-glucan 1-alpha-D-glucosylmutase